MYFNTDNLRLFKINNDYVMEIYNTFNRKFYQFTFTDDQKEILKEALSITIPD